MSEKPEPNAPEPPRGPAAAEATAEPGASPRVQAAALAYYMGEEPPPGSRTRLIRDVDLGTPDAPNFQRHVFKLLGAEEIDKCGELAQERDERTGEIVRIVPFRRWCYVFAYACLEPNLGDALARRRENGTAGELKDTSGIVAEVFRLQPGVLQNVVAEIEAKSRLGESKDRSLVEVEAGKT